MVENDLLASSKELTLIDLNLEDALFEELYGDSVMVGVALNFERIDLTCIKPLDLTPMSSPLLATTPSHLHTFYESLGDIRGYNCSSDAQVHT